MRSKSGRLDVVLDIDAHKRPAVTMVTQGARLVGFLTDTTADSGATEVKQRRSPPTGQETDPSNDSHEPKLA
jgi:hypothetical protein